MRVLLHSLRHGIIAKAGRTPRTPACGLAVADIELAVAISRCYCILVDKPPLCHREINAATTYMEAAITASLLHCFEAAWPMHDVL